MQVFLPYPDVQRSLEVLDYRRLGKQRVEAWQILYTLKGYSSGWKHHPAVKMFSGYEIFLTHYFNTAIATWISRGYKNNMVQLEVPTNYPIPPWFGYERFHASHRANLLRKDPVFYSKYGWTEDPTLPYFWPIQ